MSEQTSRPPSPDKSITAYCEPWSLRSGESVSLYASGLTPSDARLGLVRLLCGDPTSAGPGFAEEEVVSDLVDRISLPHQPLTPGSYGHVDLSGLRATQRIGFGLHVMATVPDESQTLLTLDGDGFALSLTLTHGQPVFRCGSANSELTDLVTLRGRPLAERRWYEIQGSLDLATGEFSAQVTTKPSASPGRDMFELASEQITQTLSCAVNQQVDFTSFILGGVSNGQGAERGSHQGDFDGRISQPSLALDDAVMTWDLAADMGGRTFADTSSLQRHGELHQLPARAVTGPSWDGSQQRWTDAPDHWDAIHFHKDDLYDAGWDVTASLTVANDLPSGIYAFRIETDDEVDRVPFFVRPAEGSSTADVALLMSSATYMAYANHRMLFEGADFIGSRTRLRPEHEYVRQHPELGRSMYEKHPDGSGVMFSSRRRPVLNLRPGADGWNFTPDTDINAFLEQSEVGHDIIADEDVHADGLAALAPYRVIVTCSHPEYWSTTMLDALEAWQRQGGRLMYLGGNGFYWRVAFSDAWPGAMELRRAEDGVRNWSTGDGESYHAFTGEYGGMWRRNGRPPNELVGVGFAAQGFGRATYFDVNDESLSSRAAWIWDDVVIDEGRIGTSGLGGGAAGQEIDRYDQRLGSPDHAIVLASATDFGPDMVRTKEEFEASIDVALPDPYVRGDIVFYETPGGGAVFSASSISWFGALARNAYDNDIAKMTTNVLRRFADPAPFEPPSAEG